MKRFRFILFYLIIIGGFLGIIYLIVQQGIKLEAERTIVIHQNELSQWDEFLKTIFQNLSHPITILFAQIITILLAARIIGWLLKKVGQPTVIGEIMAGIILGPSVVGYYFPGFSTNLFPEQSLGNLHLISQIGLVLFMFVIGIELNLKSLKNKAHEAVVISHASIIIPFSLGMGLAYFFYHQFAPQHIEFLSFGLFMGIAMSITAFPVLARIIQERNMHKTPLGTLIITCAAVDDITAWCLLAVVIAIVKAGTFGSALYVIALAILYVLFMIKIVRPFLKRIGELHSSRENLSKPIVGIFFITLIASAYITEVIGIHALFGAFLAGAIMPENIKFRSLFIEKVEDVSLVLLIPLFFVFTGLRTEIRLLDEPYLWEATGWIILIAILGKFAGSAIAAKFVGQSWKESLIIGTLMNTRGLMELVVLHIGYDLGVLTPEVFTMMIIMALFTTIITGPLLNSIEWLFKKKTKNVPKTIIDLSKYKILISFGNPIMGRSLMRMAHSLVGNMKSNSSISALHLSPANELHTFNTSVYEEESFAPIIEEARLLDQKVIVLHKASNDIENDIVTVANQENYDLLLIGVGQSIYEGSMLGKFFGFTTRVINPENLINKITGKEKIFNNSYWDDRTNTILGNCTIPIGVFIDKGFLRPDKVLLIYFSLEDKFLLDYARKLIKNSESQVIIIDMTDKIKENAAIKEAIRSVMQISPNHISVFGFDSINTSFLATFNLMLSSKKGWEALLQGYYEWLPETPSTLIINE